MLMDYLHTYYEEAGQGKYLLALKTKRVSDEQSFLADSLVMVESIQLLIAIIYLNTFFPPSSAFQGQILPEWVSDLKPEREMFFYRIFILTAIVFEAASGVSVQVEAGRCLPGAGSCAVFWLLNRWYWCFYAMWSLRSWYITIPI